MPAQQTYAVYVCIRTHALHQIRTTLCIQLTLSTFHAQHRGTYCESTNLSCVWILFCWCESIMRIETFKPPHEYSKHQHKCKLPVCIRDDAVNLKSISHWWKWNSTLAHDFQRAMMESHSFSFTFTTAHTNWMSHANMLHFHIRRRPHVLAILRWSML